MSKRTCPSCSSQVNPRARFCPECGTRLPEEPPQHEQATVQVPHPQPRPQAPPTQAATGQQRPTSPDATRRGSYAPPSPPPHYEPARTPPPYSPRYERQAPPQYQDEYGYEPYDRYGRPAEPQYQRGRSGWRTCLLLSLLGLILLAIAGVAAFFFLLPAGQRDLIGAGPQPTLGRLPTVTPASAADGAAGSDEQQPPANGTLLLNDTFNSRPQNGAWPDQEVQGGSFHYRDGAYHITVEQPGQILWTSTTEVYSDIELAIDVMLLSGSETDNAAGLILREQAQSHFYAFQIRPDGTYAFRKSVGDGQWESLIDWERAEIIQQGIGQPNRLRVVARGTMFELYINKQLVNTVQDASFADGYIGFGISTFEQGNATAAFDNFEVRKP